MARWLARVAALVAVALVGAGAACSKSDDGGGTGGGSTASSGGAGGATSCSLTEPAWGLGGDRMLPGTDCLACHAPGETAQGSPFTVAGTVFRSASCPEPVAGATVHVEDANGTARALVTNEVGNFFTADALVATFTVSVEVDGVVEPMVSGAPSGACGSCHQGDGAPGWVWGG
ncbi:MAG: carboxypeptidase regulatory-like domain-containing protein [Myxococcales bacterium]|nr:carboxypeptidase regulatory-like domain-containing protein [Myxococcales bacterium]